MSPLMGLTPPSGAWYVSAVVLSPHGTRGTTSAASDAALIRAAADGSREALAALYDRYSSLLLALAQRMLKSRREAEDLVHDVYLEVWRQAGDYDEERGSVRSWMLMRLRSRALDRLKSASYARVVSIETTTLREDQIATDTTSTLDPDRALVRRSLAALPVDQRTILELAYFEGLALSEIAERLETPIGTVKSRLARALGKLREDLDVKGGNR